VDGSFLSEPLFTVGARTDQLAFDAATGLLHFPANAGPVILNVEDPGIRVVDVATDSVLTSASVLTGLPPRDVLVVRGPASTGAPEIPRAPLSFRLGEASPNAAADHVFRWDGRDDAGRRVAAGTDVVRLESGGEGEARKVTLVRR
jgi:hypothetical protein